MAQFTHRLLESMMFLEIGTDDVVQWVFTRFLGASVDCEYEYDYDRTFIFRGHSHQPPDKSPGFEGERSRDIWWFLAGMLLGESMEALADDETLRNAVG
jgi:hypothetical protein